MWGRQAASQMAWCVMRLDSAVTVSCDLQLPADSNPTFQGAWRDASATDQWGHWHSSCQIHSLSISHLFCHQACAFPSASQSLWAMNLDIHASEEELVFILIFLLTCSLWVLRLLFFIISKHSTNSTRSYASRTHTHKNTWRELFVAAHSHGSPKWEFHQTNTIRPLLHFSFMMLKGNANEIR